MLSVKVLRRLRPCVAPQFVRNSLSVFPHRPSPLSLSCFSGVKRNQLTVRKPSVLLNTPPALSASTRFLSTAPPSEEENLIYTGSLGLAVRGVKMFSYSTSAASLFLMPQILLKTGLGVQTFALQVAYCGIIGFFTFLTPVLLHLITKGYVIRLYHNPDRDIYTAVTYSVFLTEKKNVFHQSQVTIPAVSKMFTTFYAGQVGLLVNPDMFPVPHDYNHLMGYDKPFSFSTADMDQPDKS
ncbi:transmembrane protein 70, mitochondrial [Archocentrus centrarchus]|uniref:transmembrane protein 70, mitochondrial n=1 Tax=Archocentrus centrarchus TaxID=63155 RepID=UPI0011E9E289|nr:transmembrane protein 70, mitochondrial [Archocentrus centrarchus]